MRQSRRIDRERMSRIMYGMGREGVVPRIFSRTHHWRRTPWVAIIFTTLIALLLIGSVTRNAGKHSSSPH